jgi:hypothetical protein
MRYITTVEHIDLSSMSLLSYYMSRKDLLVEESEHSITLVAKHSFNISKNDNTRIDIRPYDMYMRYNQQL